MEPAISNLMIIDDDEVDQMLYKRIIERSGCVKNLIQMDAGDLALEYLRAPDCPPVDVILLDLRMPRMDGFEFLSILESEFDADKVPLLVVMLTTSLDPSDAERAAAHPLVKEFWNKPLEDGHVASLVRLVTQ